jgi:hypothetical protein
MNIRKLAYSLAVIMVSYDVLSTFIAAKLYGRFADLSPVLGIEMAIVIALLIISFLTP